MAEFYKFEIANWNEGTANLTLEQEAAYLRVINAIRLADQPITFNMRVLCGLWRCDVRVAKRLLNDLIAAGKLRVEGDKIINDKAVLDANSLVATRDMRRISGAAGGKASAKSRHKSLETNDTDQASASTREEEKRREEGGGGGNARAHASVPAHEEPPPSTTLPPDSWRLYDLVIEAVGLRGCDILPAPWMPPMAVIECSRFRGLGLNDDEIVAVAKGSRSRYPEPPNGPKALERPMRAYAAAKAAPQLTPPVPAITPPTQGGFHERATEQRRLEQSAIIAAAARGTTARGRT